MQLLEGIVFNEMPPLPNLTVYFRAHLSNLLAAFETIHLSLLSPPFLKECDLNLKMIFLMYLFKTFIPTPIPIHLIPYLSTTQ